MSGQSEQMSDKLNQNKTNLAFNNYLNLFLVLWDLVKYQDFVA